MLAFLLSTSLLLQAPVDSVATRLQFIADSIVRARPRLPGMLLYVENTRTNQRWTVAAGFSDSARKTPMRPDHQVRIASNTKTYVAAAILRLVEQGKLALHDPIAKHLPPEFTALLEREGMKTSVITIEQVLAHRAGFNEHPAVPSYVAAVTANPRKRWTRLEQVQLLVDSLRPVGPPGEQFKYSDTGYILLGAIVEKLTAENLGSAVRELVGFDRLGLKQTWWEVLEPTPAGVDRAHQYMNGNDTYDLDPSFDLYGGGGIVATVSDMGAYMSALLGGRVFERKATLDTMMAVRPGLFDGYGFGLYRVNTAGRRGFGHSGFWGTNAVHFPAEGITVAVALTEQTLGGPLYAMPTVVLRTILPMISP